MANTLNLGNGNWATKEDSLLAYNSENGNFKPLPFDFTRASSGTVINKDGLIETVGSGEPRIDFKDNTKGALLLEPSRSNRMTTSEPTSGGNGFVYNPRTWGNGLSNGFTANDASGGAPKYYYMAQGIANEHSAFSFYIEMADGSEPTIGSSSDVNADLSVMVKSYFLSESDVIKTNTINNIWKIQGTSLPQSLSGTGQIGVLKYSAHSNKTFYATGFQIEQGSYATSYIPTSGSAVTRVADSCLKDDINTSIINSSYPFSMYAEATYIDGNSHVLSFSKRVVSNNYYVISITGNNQVLLDARANGSTELIESGVTLVDGQKFKAAITMESATSGKICVNGNTVVSKTNFSNQAVNNQINDLLLGQLRVHSDTGDRLPLSDVKLYNTVLTDQELIALTS